MSNPQYEFHHHHRSWTVFHAQAKKYFESMLPMLVATMAGKWTAFVLNQRVPIIADTMQEVIAFCEGTHDMSQVLFVKVPRHVDGDGDDCPGNR